MGNIPLKKSYKLKGIIKMAYSEFTLERVKREFNLRTFLYHYSKLVLQS
ncbi:hypothetical protein OSCI_1630009 [Kamptonema sp. PCC 6506]|nr:hypothetical protein OSCI_1630009 [Kamptonema sp. PCC 6506]